MDNLRKQADMTKRTPTADRFWAKVHIKYDWQSCWNWTAARLPKGYGRFSYNGDVVLAHRMAYILSHGSIPDGMHIDHTCHNTSCVRPSHLRAITPKQNIENRKGANSKNNTGVRGVYLRASGRYAANVKHNRVVVYSEEFDTLEEAATAVRAVRLEYFTHSDMDRAS